MVVMEDVAKMNGLLTNKSEMCICVEQVCDHEWLSCISQYEGIAKKVLWEFKKPKPPFCHKSSAILIL